MASKSLIEKLQVGTIYSPAHLPSAPNISYVDFVQQRHHKLEEVLESAGTIHVIAPLNPWNVPNLFHFYALEQLADYSKLPDVEVSIFLRDCSAKVFQQDLDDLPRQRLEEQERRDLIATEEVRYLGDFTSGEGGQANTALLCFASEFLRTLAMSSNEPQELWIRFQKYYRFLKHSQPILSQMGHAMLAILYGLKLHREENKTTLLLLGETERLYLESLLALLTDFGYPVSLPLYMPKLDIYGENLPDVFDTEFRVIDKLRRQYSSLPNPLISIDLSVSLLRYFGERPAELKNLDYERIIISKIRSQLHDLVSGGYIFIPELSKYVGEKVSRYLSNKRPER